MGREVGVFLMVAMLGLTFCLTAPIMAPACALFFIGNFIVWRYHVLYVYERRGTLWSNPPVHARTLCSHPPN